MMRAFSALILKFSCESLRLCLFNAAHSVTRCAVILIAVRTHEVIQVKKITSWLYMLWCDAFH